MRCNTDVRKRICNVAAGLGDYALSLVIFITKARPTSLFVLDVDATILFSRQYNAVWVTSVRFNSPVVPRPHIERKVVAHHNSNAPSYN